MSKVSIFLVAVLALTAIVYKSIEYVENQLTPLPVYGLENHIVPAFEFTNQLNEMVSSTDIRDKIWVADFFFTSCPTICPKMTRNLQSLHDFIRDDQDIRILSFTVDPKRDSPERLKSYADTYRVNHESWSFLTGEKEAIYRLGNRGFLVSASTAGVEDEDFIHSENIVLVDQNQRIRGFYNGTDPKCVKQILNDIKKLKKTKA